MARTNPSAQAIRIDFIIVPYSSDFYNSWFLFSPNLLNKSILSRMRGLTDLPDLLGIFHNGPVAGKLPCIGSVHKAFADKLHAIVSIVRVNL